jgi:fumarate hydratase subunit alpha
MKKITKKKIIESVSRLCFQANIHLRQDVRTALRKALKIERHARAKKILTQLLLNAQIAAADKVALCQDTGLPIVFAEIGRDVDISGIDISRAINRGVEVGYRKAYLRDSLVSDPLLRSGSPRFSPCIIHYRFSRQKGLKLTVLPKGFGCENKTKLKMFNPTVPLQEIMDFIVSAVKEAGPDACPPYIVGVGIGGSADYACQLSKEALLRLIGKKNSLRHVAQFETELLKKINQLNIGPMGLGGDITALAVHVLTYPMHIAGLPVCVNISCHVLRSASVVLS